MYSFNSMDEALVQLLSDCRENGVFRKPEWQENGCTEFPFPVLFRLENPLARFTTIAERKMNVALAVAESVWVLRGLNNLDDLPGHYAKAVYSFSDDGRYYRAGYGPRLRHYNGTQVQYAIGETTKAGGIDQLKFVIDALTNDPFTRQADITIHDPIKDDFDTNGNLLKTKDTPCTRSLHFLTNHEGKLDLIVRMRSNDIIRGADAINVPLFTFIQQIVSQVTGIPLGSYYHIADSLHYYDIHEEMVDSIINSNYAPVNMEGFSYKSPKIRLRDVDDAIDWLLMYEHKLMAGEGLDAADPFENDPRFEVFSDYAQVFRAYWGKKAGLEPEPLTMFLHPQLRFIFSK